MLRISAIVAGALALSGSVAMAQTGGESVAGDGTSASAPPQQAMAPAGTTRSGNSFIIDEYGNVYDSHGEIIKPRPLKHPLKPSLSSALPSDR